MEIHSTSINARENLSRRCDEVTRYQEVVVISRRGIDDIALISAEESLVPLRRPISFELQSMLSADRTDFLQVRYRY